MIPPWLSDRNSTFRTYLNLTTNFLMLGLLAWVLMDYNGFRTSIECKAYQPVIEAAKQCDYGVRIDLCYQPISTHEFDIINVGQANLTELFYPNPLEVVK